MKTKIIAATLAFLACPASAEDLTFTLKNSSSLTIAQFFTSPVGVDEWEEDVFGEGVLLPGFEVEVLIADGREHCDYDLKFVAQDGQELTDTVDMCELASYELVDN